MQFEAMCVQFDVSVEAYTFCSRPSIYRPNCTFWSLLESKFAQCLFRAAERARSNWTSQKVWSLHNVAKKFSSLRPVQVAKGLDFAQLVKVRPSYTYKVRIVQICAVSKFEISARLVWSLCSCEMFARFEDFARLKIDVKIAQAWICAQVSLFKRRANFDLRENVLLRTILLRFQTCSICELAI